jgi:hypothetical protein
MKTEDNSFGCPNSPRRKPRSPPCRTQSNQPNQMEIVMFATPTEGITPATLHEAFHGAGADPLLKLAISDEFIAGVLRPYRENARYLKSAVITQFDEKAIAPDTASNGSIITGSGRFSIPESCYIDATGHFNAVEFNICFNQLAYVLFGKCVDAGLMQRYVPSLGKQMPSMTEYDRYQLPAMVIVRMEGVRFLKQMQSLDFHGEMTLNRMSFLGPVCFLFTSIAFSDHEGLKAKGSVVLAFSPTFGMVKH